MRIGGTATKRLGEGRVRLPQADGSFLELKVRAYPLGYDLDDAFPLPQPPKIKARRVNGVVERDGNDRVIWDTNDQDPAYRQARERVMRARKAAGTAKALVIGDGPGEIRFDTDVSSGSVDAYLALWDEMVAAGLVEGDLIAIAMKARDLSGMSDKAMELALSDFSPGAESPTGSDPAAR